MKAWSLRLLRRFHRWLGKKLRKPRLIKIDLHTETYECDFGRVTIIPDMFMGYSPCPTPQPTLKLHAIGPLRGGPVRGKRAAAKAGKATGKGTTTTTAARKGQRRRRAGKKIHGD
jgi:hypothetical protein